MIIPLSFILALLSCLPSICFCLPSVSPTVTVRAAPQPSNGTIELHHDPTTSKWYLLVSLDPSNFTKTTGNKTIVGKHNPLSTVTVFYTITANKEAGSNITDYTIHSNPVAFEHHIVDPLTSITIYNLPEQFYPEGQPVFFSVDIDGTSAGSVSYDSGVLHGEGFATDLNLKHNITGFFSGLSS